MRTGGQVTHVTETVYRHVIAPAIQGGATVMDSVFDNPSHDTDRGSQYPDNAKSA
jgi:hypothetical protein